jgi:hypothetical protein
MLNQFFIDRKTYRNEDEDFDIYVDWIMKETSEGVLTNVTKIDKKTNEDFEIGPFLIYYDEIEFWKEII